MQVRVPSIPSNAGVLTLWMVCMGIKKSVTFIVDIIRKNRTVSVTYGRASDISAASFRP